MEALTRLISSSCDDHYEQRQSTMPSSSFIRPILLLSKHTILSSCLVHSMPTWLQNSNDEHILSTLQIKLQCDHCISEQISVSVVEVPRVWQRWRSLEFASSSSHYRSLTTSRPTPSTMLTIMAIISSCRIVRSSHH